MKYYIYFFFNFKAEQNSANTGTIFAVGVIIYPEQLGVLFSIHQISKFSWKACTSVNISFSWSKEFYPQSCYTGIRKYRWIST